MSARSVLQAAVMAALKTAPALGGCRLFDAPPMRGALPCAVVEEPLLVDWSSKTWSGREGRIAIATMDAGERPVRLRQLTGAIEDAVAAIPPSLGEGWRVAQLRLVRSRIVRDGEARWRASSEFMVRIYRENG